jgi:hypothetical protein
VIGGVLWLEEKGKEALRECNPSISCSGRRLCHKAPNRGLKDGLTGDGIRGLLECGKADDLKVRSFRVLRAIVARILPPSVP